MLRHDPVQLHMQAVTGTLWQSIAEPDLKLTLFYDSLCPLCVSEVGQLQTLDQQGAMEFVDIHEEGFREDWPHIDPEAANRVLHAQWEDGTMLYGLDVSAQAWSLVGRHRWLKLLRLPVVRWFADLAYRIFARHRYTISYLLTGQRRCERCVIGHDRPGCRRQIAAEK